MKEQLWTIGQRTTALFDLINDMRWEDQAAKDIRIRHLNTLETDGKAMLTAYRDQNNSLELTKDQLKLAESHRKQAYEAGKNVYRQHGHVQEEIRQADQMFEQSKKQESAARLQLPRIQQLINSANQAGK